MKPDEFKKEKCRYCDSRLPGAFLNLGSMPLANNLLRPEDLESEEFQCPLRLTYCPNCHLVQLTHAVPPEKMFSHYLYVSSTTKTFQHHFAEYAHTVRQKLSKKDKPLAVDIGSNDGLLVSCYQKEGMRALGVDPAANLAEDANQRGLKTINRFFDAACVQQILAEEGKADVVSGNNVFAHIDDIQPVCKNVQALLTDQGIFVIEFPYLPVMLETLVFDMIYHEHLSYIALTPLGYLLRRFGMEVFDVQEVSSHGGSLRVFIQKKGGPYTVSEKVEKMIHEEREKGYLTEAAYKKFAEQVLQVKKNFMDLVRGLKASGQTLSGYGAPAKASTILNFYGLNPREIEYIVDDNPLKQGYFVPGARIPIVPSRHMETHPTDYVIIFAWNFAKEILNKIGHFKDRGTQFLIPLVGPEALLAKTGSVSSFSV